MADKPDRNDPCHCGSGQKYKNCHMDKDQSGAKSKAAAIVLSVAVLLGILLIALSIMGGGSPDCPPGQVWSDAHNHCH
ncbi:MAG: SEC-C domain-containing protein [Balneolaceae bacterium]|nr:SEC-C domain-containing protein [Balneolaceae bacterium]MCH8549400.1 SEC-C domain-containing protein [Balneolaceae bacterium]